MLMQGSGIQASFEETFMTSASKRKYNRRSEEQRIADLEKRISELQARQSAKEERAKARERQRSEVLREIPKIRKRLLKFSQLAMDNGRMDIANSVTAFLAGLDRFRDEDITEEVHWSRPIGDEEAD